MAARINRRFGQGKHRHRKTKRSSHTQVTHPTFRVEPAPTGAMTMATASTSYAMYVGRVGALAVALGVGVAVATGQGLGLARAEGDPPSNESPSVNSPADPPPNAQSPDPSKDPTPSTAPTPSAGSPSGPIHSPTPPKMIYDNSGDPRMSGDDEDSTEPTTEHTPAPPPPASPTTQTVAPALTTGAPTTAAPPPPALVDLQTSAPQGDSTTTAPAPVDNVPLIEMPIATPPADDPLDTAGVGGHLQSRLMSTFVADDPADTGNQQLFMATTAIQQDSALTATQAAPAPLVPQPSGPVDVLLGLPAATINMAATVASMLLAPFLAPGPVNPVQPPLVLFAVLDWVRREIQRTFFNRTPDAVVDTVTTSEDLAKTIPVLANDTDADGDVKTVTAVTPPQHGTAVLNPNGTITYTPNANFNGTDTFTYTISDAASPGHIHGLGGFLFGGGHTDTARVNVTVTGVNDQPDAANDNASVAEDSIANPINVRGNDTDVDGDTLTVTNVTNGAHGTVAITGGGTGLTYTPAANFHGNDSFSYTISDGHGGTDTATVAVTVTPVNDPPNAVNDTVTVTEDSIANPINVLANDTDIDAGDTKTVDDVTQGTNGSVLNNGNSVLYTPNPGFHGTDSFTYTMSDSAGATSTATVNITVTAVEDAPVAVDDGPYTIAEDGSRIFTPAELVGNDTDNDAGETLSVASVGGAVNGVVSHNTTTGEVTFTPTANYNGPASFTYTVKDTDGTLSLATATVNITVTAVEDAPVAVDDGPYTIAEDGSRIFTPAELVGNDTDNDAGETLSVASVGGAVNGVVSHNTTTGEVTFTPTANYNGPASFTYTVKDTDGTLSLATATVNITVTAVEDAPVAVDDGPYTIAEDGSRIFTPAELVGNDTDNDAGETLSVASVGGAVNGVVSHNTTTGEVTFTPTANYNGPASFTYTVKDTDGTLSLATATVNITVTAVEDAPVAVDDGPYTIAEDGSRIFTPAELVGNDTDNDAGETLSVASVGGAVNGVVSHNTTTGEVTFTPTANYNGPASFTYTVKDTDGTLSLATATVNITVTAVEDAPVAVDDGPYTIAEDGSRIFTPAELVGNDTDNDAGETLSVASVGGAVNGVVSHNTTTGEVTFTPTANYNGPASFTYTVKDTDGTLSLATATVNITVTAVEDAPVAVDDGPYTIAEDGSRIFTPAELVGNDTDNDAGETLSVASVGGAVNGVVSHNTTTGEVTFTPTANYNGPASFTYTVKDTDGTLSLATATVNITVTAVEDAPVAVDDGPYTIAEDGSRIFTPAELVGNDTDNDAGETLSVASVGGAVNGVVSHNTTTGEVTFTPTANYNGPASFTYTVKDTDGTLSLATATVNITVTAVEDAPVAVDDGPYTIAEDGSRIFTPAELVGNDTDNDAGETLSVASVGGAVNGVVSHNTTTGEVTFTPTANYNGPASFTYTVKDTDGTLSLATATVNITVTAVEDAPVAVDDGPYTIAEDGSRIFTPAELVGNDTDNDAGETLSVASVGGAVNGVVSHNTTTGEVTFTPTANYNGPASFTYTVKDTDGTLSLATATVNITVTAVEDAPVAVDDGPYTIAEDGSRIFTPAELVGNDTDNDAGETLSVASVGGAVNGVVSHNTTTGEVTFTPTANYNGPASFTYTVKDTDGTLSLATATVNITVTAVEDAPVAVDDGPYTIAEDGSRIFTPAELVGNDTDNDAGETLSVASVGGAVNGVVSHNTTTGEVTFTPTANYNGPASFTYTVKDTDGTLSLATATVNITVTPVEDAPVAVDDGPYTIAEDGSRIFTPAELVGNDTDNDAGETLSVASVGGAVNGVVSHNTTTGEVTFTPTANYNGPASFTYTVKDTDGTLSLATATVNITVTAVEDAPVAVDDGPYTIAEDGSRIFTPAELVGNDTDNDAGETLSVASVGGAVNGVVSHNTTTGEVTFTPTANYNGPASFTYTVKDTDGTLSLATATVNITVTPVEDAPVAVDDGPYTIAEDGSRIFTPAELVGNDTDNDAGETLSVASVGGAVNGVVSHNTTTGEVTFTPTANYNGPASFTYTVKDTDGTLSLATATVNITVTPVEDAPVAVDDGPYTIAEDGSRIFTPAELVGNDTDNDAGETLSVASVGGAVNGVVSHNTTTGEVTFTPTANYNGPASFTYTVKDTDGTLSLATATVNITVTPVEDAPVAVDDGPYTIAEDGSRIFTPAELVGNDTDNDAGETLSVASVGGAVNGVVSHNTTTGEVTFTPTANYNGPASFTYTVKDTDGTLSLATATVNITVTAVEDAPVAVDDGPYTIAEDGSRIFTPAELVGNDTDNDAGETLSVASVGGAVNGVVSHNTTTGEVTFTPTANYNGPASFTYTVKDTDGTLSLATATVNITVTAVEDAPVAVDDGPYTIAEDGSRIFTPAELVGNDTDNDAGETLSVASVGGAVNGVVSHNTTTGEVTFTPTANYNGPASFTYTVKDTDGTLSLATATVNITVTPVEDAPVAVDDGPYTIAEDGSRIFTPAELVGNDTDNDAGETLSVASVGGAVNGVVSHNTTTGEVTFTPTANYNGPASFTYTVKDTDGTLSLATATVNITVTPVEDAPVAVDDGPYTIAEDGSRIFTPAELVGNDTDNDAGETLSVASVGGAVNGVVSHNTTTGEVTFTPTANYNGPASFTYTVKDTDGTLSLATATVNITVTPVEDAPVAVDDGPYTIAEDGSRIFTPAELVGNDTDNDAGETLSVASVGGAVNGVVSHNTTTGEVTFTPTANYNGPASFTYTVKDTDGTLSLATATVNITVTPVEDAPVAVDDGPYTIAEDGSRIFTPAELVGNDTDNDAGETLSVASVGGAVNGVVSHNTTTGEVTFTPTANYNGPASFTYTVKDTDGTLSLATATVNITVTPVEDAPVAVDDGPYTIAEDGSRIFTPAELVGNDTDNDAGETLSVASVGGAVNGVVSHNTTTGEVTFTPTANYNGPASFTYTVKDTDGTLSLATATVNITVTPVEDAPVAVDDGPYTIAEDGSRIFTPAELVGNDTDNDAGETLSVASVGGAVNGVVSHNTTTGEVTFTPTANYNGPASFTYTVKDTDGTLSLATATVNITVTPVEDAPVAVDDGPYTIAEDGSRIFTPAELVGNDTDNDAGETLSVASVGGAVNGVVSHNTTTGEVTFTPTANYNGPASFTYTVKDTDGTLSLATATVNITVTPVEDAPVAVDDGPYTIAEDGSRIFTPAELVGNDTDNDAGETLSVASVGGAVNGVVSHNTTTGEVTFTPTANYNGPASFTYTVKDTDGTLSLATATVNITVTPVNDAPTGNPTTPAPGTFGVVSGTLGGNDVDGNTFTYNVTDQPDQGTLVIDQVTGTYTYTPHTNARLNAQATPAADIDTFKFRVVDQHGLNSVEYTVTPTIAPAQNIAVASAIPVGSDPNEIVVGTTGGSAGRVYVANAASNSISVIDTATNTVTEIDFDDPAVNANVANPQSLALSTDGNRLFVGTTTTVGGSNAAVTVINTATGTVVDVDPVASGVNSLVVGGGTVTSIAVEGNNVFLAFNTAGNGFLMRSTYNSVTDTFSPLIQTITGINKPVALFITGGRVYVANTGNAGNDTVTAYNTGTLALTNTFTVGSDPTAVVVTGNRLLTTNSNNTVTSVNIANNNTSTVVVGIAPTAVTVRGTRAYVTNSDGSITVLNLPASANTAPTVVDMNPATPAVIDPIPVGVAMRGIVIRPDGKVAYVTGSDGKVYAITFIPAV